MDDFSTGPEFYDDEAVFATYHQHRHNNPNSPNDTLEQPVLDELLGEVGGKVILDLGCGDGAFGLALLARGAQSYLGVDGSKKMLALAQERLAGTQGRAALADLEDYQPPEAAFNLAVSRLALHYILQLDRLLAAVYQSLRPGGRLIFSVEHPVITSCNRSFPPGSIRQDWIVDDYFDSGPRVTEWLGGRVMKVHRSIEDYFRAVQEAGFTVEALRELRPRRELFQEEALYQRRMRIPLFLFLAGRKG